MYSLFKKTVFLFTFFSVVAYSLSFSVIAQEYKREGYWYYDSFNLEKLHEEGIDGSEVKIADIDTMINPDVEWLSDANIVIREKNITPFYGDISPVTKDFEKAYHATDMLGILQGNGKGALSGSAQIGIAPKAIVYHYAAVTSEDDSITGGDVYDEAVRLALEDNVDIISIPAGGLSFFDKQYPYILEALRRGIPVIAAHANSPVRMNQTLAPDTYFDSDNNRLEYDVLPTSSIKDEICYWPGMVTVQALNEAGGLQSHSNIDDPGTDICAPGDDIWMQFNDWGYFETRDGGCSTATTTVAGYLALAMDKWQNATGNQILQLMVHTAANQTKNAAGKNDGSSVTGLIRDRYTGFGMIDVNSMLDTDPSIYPDVNPLLYIDLYREVTFAKAKNSLNELKENKNILEIAEVLDSQLQSENIDRPDFLIALLGEREALDESPSTNAAQSPLPEVKSPEENKEPPLEKAVSDFVSSKTGIIVIFSLSAILISVVLKLFSSNRKS